MENSKTARALYVLFAVALSAAIWFYVDQFGNNGSSFQADMEITDIPIEYRGGETLADRGLMLVDEDTTTSVNITFEGARLLVTQLDRSRIRLTADLSTVTTAGLQSIRYTVTYLDEQHRTSFMANQKFSRLSFRKQSPETATVNISELASKEVDVRCEMVGTISDNYSAEQPQLSQDKVEVRGFEEDIAPIAYAKVALDIGDSAEASINRSLPLQFYDAENNRVSSENIYPSVDFIQVSLPVYVTKEVSLVVDIYGAPGVSTQNITYTLKPETITVRGEASSLKDRDSLILGELNLLDLIGTAQTTQTFFYPITVPDGCENQTGVSRATMTLVFNDLEVREVAATRFVIDTELSDNKTVDVMTESLPVTIFGKSADVEAVSGADITVTPNLSDYAAAEGVYTVPADVSVRAQGDVGISGVYEVQVSIQEPPEETEQPEETDAAPSRSDTEPAAAEQTAESGQNPEPAETESGAVSAAEPESDTAAAEPDAAPTEPDAVTAPAQSASDGN